MGERPLTRRTRPASITIAAEHSEINQMPDVTRRSPARISRGRTTVRVQDGKALTSDGPYIGTEQAIGVHGYPCQLDADVLARLVRLDQLRELVELAGEARFGALEQLQNMGIHKLVADTDALLVTRYDACPLQDAEMLRDVLLGRFQRVDEFLHARGADRQAVDELYPHGLAEHAQAFRDQVRSPV
jgi:hypothetical protein